MEHFGNYEVKFKGQAYGQIHGVPYETYCVTQGKN